MRALDNLNRQSEIHKRATDIERVYSLFDTGELKRDLKNIRAVLGDTILVSRNKKRSYH
jgi:hypothetical protein